MARLLLLTINFANDVVVCNSRSAVFDISSDMEVLQYLMHSVIHRVGCGAPVACARTSNGRGTTTFLELC